MLKSWDSNEEDCEDWGVANLDPGDGTMDADEFLKLEVCYLCESPRVWCLVISQMAW